MRCIQSKYIIKEEHFPINIKYFATYLHAGHKTCTKVNKENRCEYLATYGKPNAHLLEKPGFAKKNLVLRFDKPGFALVIRVFSAKPGFSIAKPCFSLQNQVFSVYLVLL